MPSIFTATALLKTISTYSDAIFAWGWLFVLIFILWVAWEVYIFLKRLDYATAMKWTYWQITLPDESLETPKAMENAFEIWSGIHKEPDLIELFFEGYMLAWYSCELHCTPGRVRYIMVVPTMHRKFFEGVIYGQYPHAHIEDVEDYALTLSHHDLEKTFDMYGTEMLLARDDYYPVRTYHEYEDALAEDDRYIDPHQALVEAYTTIEQGEQFWLQILVRPVSAKVTSAWAQKGEEKINEISGRPAKKKMGIVGTILSLAVDLPGYMGRALTTEVSEERRREEKPLFRFLNPAEEATVKGIFEKISRQGNKCKIRVIHISPAGKLNKPNISKAIGALKQFNTTHLNAFMPDPATKSNGPNYILKQTRRRFRKRYNLLMYQWRDFFGTDAAGYMMTAEELATLWHLPAKYMRTPSVVRATTGLGSAPENLPYA